MITRDEVERQIAPRLLTMRIIIGALAMACVTFGAVAIYLQMANPSRLEYAWSVVAIFSGIEFILYLIVPPQIARVAIAKLRREANVGSHGEVDQGTNLVDLVTVAYQTKMIVAAALAEGAFFMTMNFYMMYGDPILLAVSGISFFLLIIRFPVRSRVVNWVSDRLQSIHEEQSFPTVR